MAMTSKYLAATRRSKEMISMNPPVFSRGCLTAFSVMVFTWLTSVRQLAWPLVCICENMVRLYSLTNALVIGVQNLLNDQCTGSVSCCQKSDGEAVSCLTSINRITELILLGNRAHQSFNSLHCYRKSHWIKPQDVIWSTLVRGLGYELLRTMLRRWRLGGTESLGDNGTMDF